MVGLPTRNSDHKPTTPTSTVGAPLSTKPEISCGRNGPALRRLQADCDGLPEGEIRSCLRHLESLVAQARTWPVEFLRGESDVLTALAVIVRPNRSRGLTMLVSLFPVISFEAAPDLSTAATVQSCAVVEELFFRGWVAPADVAAVAADTLYGQLLGWHPKGFGRDRFVHGFRQFVFQLLVGFDFV